MMIRLSIFVLLASRLIFSQDCETGYTEINSLCFHEGDIGVLQKFIDNSYATGFTEENCETHLIKKWTNKQKKKCYF